MQERPRLLSTIGPAGFAAAKPAAPLILPNRSRPCFPFFCGHFAYRMVRRNLRAMRYSGNGMTPPTRIHQRAKEAIMSPFLIDMVRHGVAGRVPRGRLPL